MRKIEINYNNTENLINNLRTVVYDLDSEQRSIKQALGEIYDLENYYRNRNEIIDELEFRERKIHDDIRNTEELIKSIESFSRNVQETDERLAHKFKQDIKSYAKVNNLELVSDFEKWLNGIQTGLDAWGTLSPGPVADGLNGIIYFLRGDMKNGLISLAGIVPYAGDSLKGVRYLDKASDILKYTDKAVDLKKSSKKISKATKNLDIKDIIINKKTQADVIYERTKHLDLTPKQKPYNIHSSKKIKELKAKKANRTMTKEEWKASEWNRRFKRRRDMGVDSFWEQERKRILNGEEWTRNWDKNQVEDILNSKRPKYNGNTIIGHHTYSASQYPHLANKGEVIYPTTKREHFYGWHGGNYKKSKPGSPINSEINDF